MADAENMSIVAELIKEVKSYLPEMKTHLVTLGKNSTDEFAKTELQRLYHTIKGAALMVGLENLGQSAAILEDILDDISIKNIPVSADLINAMGPVIDRMEIYCSSLDGGDDDGSELFAFTQKTFEPFEYSSKNLHSQDEEQALFPNFSDEDSDADDDDFFMQLSEEDNDDDFLLHLTDEDNGSDEELDSLFGDDEENDDLDDLFAEESPEGDELIELPGEDAFPACDTTNDLSGELDGNAPASTVIDPELQACFQEETEEHLENIALQLNELSSSVESATFLDGQLKEGLHSLRRSVHTLKGAAAVIGIESVAAWGHEFEDFLDWLHDDAQSLSPDTIAIMFEGADLLEQLSHNPGAVVKDDIGRIKDHFVLAMSDPQPIDSESGLPQDDGLGANADQNLPLIDPELQESFNQEAEEHLDNIASELNTLSSSVIDTAPVDPEILEKLHSIRRSVHTLKGAAAVIGIESVAAWGHKFEDFLDWLHDDASTISPLIINSLFSGTEILEKLAGDPLTDVENEIEQLTSSFKEIIEKNQIITTGLVDQELPANEDALSGQPSEGGGIDPELQESFDEEAVEHLESITSQLNELSASVNKNVPVGSEILEKLHSIRRSVHTLKGAAAVIGIESVAAWGHKFEDFLDWLHDEAGTLSPAIISSLFDGTEILEKLAGNPSLDTSYEVNLLTETFQEIMKSVPGIDEQDFSSAADRVDVNKEDIQQDLAKSLLPASSDAVKSTDSIHDTADLSTQNKIIIEPEIHKIFQEEAEEYLENIGRQLNELSTNINGPGASSEDSRGRIRSIRHSVHALKGAAMVSGITTIAECGHVFEDFLDSLHEKKDSLTAEIVTAMLECSDIIDQISSDPMKIVGNEVSRITAVCHQVTEGGLPPADKDKKSSPAEQIVIPDSSPRGQMATSRKDSIIFTGKRDKQTVARRKTLRVEVEKIAEVMGLSGDMSINLSSFENSMITMDFNLHELDMTLQRLKGIASSLETGYEMSSLPHLGVVSGDSQNESSLADEFDPLEMDRYSELHILIRSLNEAVVDLDSIKDQSFDVKNSWHLAIDRQRGIVSEVQGAVRAIQMTPFSTLANRLYKTVRESARATKKKVRLLIEGGALEMDTHVWDVLADALMHMLRNAVDHGIESIENRQKAGKSEQATIRIICSRQGSRFVLRLSDDGSGLDYPAIRKRAQDLFPEMNVQGMEDRDLGALIFKQGFSVRTQVTNISGRGVGMDVVSNAIAQLNGNIEVLSRPGEGTDFILSMPIVVAQLPALIVRFGTESFAVPMRDISRVVRLTEEEKKQDHYILDGDTLPLLNPVELLRLPQDTHLELDGDSYLSSLALVVETAGKRAIVLADAVLGQMEIVFKSLGAHLLQVPCVAGATIMGDGSLVPILQTEDLFEIEQLDTGADLVEEEPVSKEKKTLNVLIVDDSISIRKVLSNFIARNGWQPRTAFDGVDAMERIRETMPDLIISDIEMPRMNGFELLQSLQAQTAYRSIPVLMLTSRSAEKYVEKATQLGARGFVTKPFKDDELFGLINSLFSK